MIRSPKVLLNNARLTANLTRSLHSRGALAAARKSEQSESHDSSPSTAVTSHRGRPAGEGSLARRGDFASPFDLMQPFLGRSMLSDLDPFGDRLFRNMMRPLAPIMREFAEGPALEMANLAAPLDLHETDTAYEVKMDVPAGIKKEDLHVALDSDRLTISGEKKEEKEEDKKVRGKTVHRSERHYGSFSRSVMFDRPVATDKVEAHFKNGVLNITVPKTEPTTTKHVEVKLED